MVANQIVCSRFKRRAIIKFLLVEKCKLNRRMYAYGEVCFTQEEFTDGLKMALLPRACVKLTMKMHWLSGKEKFLTQRSVKTVMLTVM